MICFLSAKKRAAKPRITVRFYYPWDPKNNFFFRREGQRERTSEEESACTRRSDLKANSSLTVLEREASPTKTAISI